MFVLVEAISMGWNLIHSKRCQPFSHLKMILEANQNSEVKGHPSASGFGRVAIQQCLLTLVLAKPLYGVICGAGTTPT